MILLHCEICGREFSAAHHRKKEHCRDCAEKLRSVGQGPIQQKQARADHKPVCEPKQLDWSQSSKYLVYYLNRFNRYPVYDGVCPKELDKITDEDRNLANKIGAKMSKSVWAPLVGNSISRIGQWDLLRMDDDEWGENANVTRKEIGNLLRSGIRIARLTKALHRKRPRLLPICDSVLRSALNVNAITELEILLECMAKLRQVGQLKIETLLELHRLSKDNNAELSELRILELLYWVQYGPFPIPIIF